MADTLPDVAPIRLARIETFVHRAVLERPMRASFGTLEARSTLLVRVEDADGAHGWGECWVTWPSFGAEHRALHVERTLAPLTFETDRSPAETFQELTSRTAVLALQTAEPGPLAQATGGLDMALWDLAARREGRPLASLLGATASDVPAYASGIAPDEAPDVVDRERKAGHRRFKLKLGFGRAIDLPAVAGLRAALRDGEGLMLDANQAWSREEARAMAEAVVVHDPLWLEEPLPADAPAGDWAQVAEAGVPLAGGENLVGRTTFDRAIADGHLAVVQPDAGKWGGVTGCLAVARAARAAGRLYCPHHLGGMVGLAVAAHITAACGDPRSLLEVDVNRNPLREAMAPALPINGGRAALPPGPGLGIEPDLDAMAPFLARHGEAVR